MALDLSIEMELIERRVILRLFGRIDAVTAPTLEKKMDILINEKHWQILLDLTGLDYLSSAGMRLMLSESKKLKAKGGYLVIFSIQEDIFEIIKMAGFDRVLNICSSEKEALRFVVKP